MLLSLLTHLGYKHPFLIGMSNAFFDAATQRFVFFQLHIEYLSFGKVFLARLCKQWNPTASYKSLLSSSSSL